ncbi:conserved hypothetical protein [uncultured Alphaproteobacteria bacterium]|uniref:Transmembrane protein n=1 Tax=uncultured Alphaproteobacteria bacterium TaxID=91750 RepID=A0A212KLP4_9PROT|nr:conserved hypothetical protein [uncultured Alphaproteobacteria bacterium]
MTAPTPEDRAQIVVRILEQAIREGRNETSLRTKSGRPGLSFRQWQDIAAVEIANAIRDAEAEVTKRKGVGNRIAMTLGACLVTLGFFGAAVAWGRVDRTLAAVASLAAGAGLLMTAMEIPLRLSWRKARAKRRARKFENIRSLDKQIRALERFLEDKKETLEEQIEPLRRP